MVAKYLILHDVVVDGEFRSKGYVPFNPSTGKPMNIEPVRTATEAVMIIEMTMRKTAQMKTADAVWMQSNDR